jgi:transposase
MKILNLTEDLIQQIRANYRSSSNFKIRQRMHFLLLKNKGYSYNMIADILEVSFKTLINWAELFQIGHLDALTTLNYKGQPSILKKYGEQLVFEFIKKPVSTFKEARHRIRTLTGLERSLPQVRHFLIQNKLRRRKVGQIPKNADIEAQEKFKHGRLRRLIQLAESHRIRLLFLDASHFVHQPFLGYLYSLKRIFIPAAAGRKRYNVLGALDAITHTLTTVCNDSYINAQAVCQLLECLAKQYIGEKIYLVLDNARYQKCALVKQMANQFKIELVFLPPYSPNLNLIERLWRFTKKKVLYNEFYSTFQEFKHAITKCCETVQTGNCEEELQSLLTLNFQSFEMCKNNP